MRGTAPAAGIAAIDRSVRPDASALPLTERHVLLPLLSDPCFPGVSVSSSDPLSDHAAWTPGDGGDVDCPDRIARELAELDRELNRLRREMRKKIESKLARFVGRSLGSLAANRELAASIHALLESHGLRVRCSECGHPAILRVSPRPGSRSGAFVFDHTIAGRRTFHGGGGRFPELSLVAKPARRAAG